MVVSSVCIIDEVRGRVSGMKKGEEKGGEAGSGKREGGGVVCYRSETTNINAGYKTKSALQTTKSKPSRRNVFN